MATVNADGAVTASTMFGPFGEKLPSQPIPQDATDSTSEGYLAIPRKSTESDFSTSPIQMGARVYIPELGRFLQIDPVEGGTPNAYTYPLDPVNQRDMSGEFVFAIPVLLAPIITPIWGYVSSALAGAVAGACVGFVTTQFYNTTVDTSATTRIKTATPPIPPSKKMSYLHFSYGCDTCG